MMPHNWAAISPPLLPQLAKRAEESGAPEVRAQLDLTEVLGPCLALTSAEASTFGSGSVLSLSPDLLSHSDHLLPLLIPTPQFP